MPEAPRRVAPGGLIRTGVLRRLLLAVAVGSLLLCDTARDERRRQCQPDHALSGRGRAAR